MAEYFVLHPYLDRADPLLGPRGSAAGAAAVSGHRSLVCKQSPAPALVLVLVLVQRACPSAARARVSWARAPPARALERVRPPGCAWLAA